MRLIIPDINELQKLGDLHIGAIIQDFEQKIADQYFVYPVMSNKAYEVFEMPNKQIKQLHHTVFGYKTKGRKSDINTVYRLFNLLWDDVQKAWNPRDSVMWRRRPEIIEENNKDQGWFESGKDAPDSNAPDDWYILVLISLGSFNKPKTVKSIKIEGEQIQSVVL